MLVLLVLFGIHAASIQDASSASSILPKQCNANFKYFLDDIDCGPILMRLAAKCASVVHSTKEECCPILKEWNDAHCWCDPNAYKAASDLSGNEYAFQFRSDACNIRELYRPSVSLPNLMRTILRNSCLKRSKSFTTPRNPEMQFLVLKRLRLLKKLADIGIGGGPLRLRKLMTVDVDWTEIGLGQTIGRMATKQRLAHREKLALRVLIHENTMVWRSRNTVSYQVTARRGEYLFHRAEFVVFECGGERITRLTMLDDQTSRIFQQFVRIDPTMRTWWSITMQSPTYICRQIQRTCGQLSPFPKDKECLKFYKELEADNRMGCIKFKNHSSLALLQGNTSACRLYYLTLARTEPKFCKMVGIDAIDQCAENKCSSEGYGNLFANGSMQYKWQPHFQCSFKMCVEKWPIRQEKREKRQLTYNAVLL